MRPASRICLLTGLAWTAISATAQAAPPGNDAFAMPQSISAAGAAVAGDTREASREAGEQNHNAANGTASVWYTLTTTAAGAIEIDVCDAAFDTALAAYQGTTLASPEVASEECKIAFPVLAAQTYRVAVDGAGGERGRFTLRLQYRSVPGNDAFAGAPPLTGASVNVAGDSRGASREAGEPVVVPGATASVWWSWNSPVTGAVRFDVCDEEERELTVAVYTGTSFGTLVTHARRECNGWFGVTGGADYKIAVEGDRTTFNLRLNAFAKPANDDFSEAAVLTGTAASTSGDNRGATFQSGEGNHAAGAGTTPNGTASVWYSWTAPVDFSGTIDVDTCGDLDLDLDVAIYTGSAINALTTVARTSDCITRGAVSPGVTYQIAVQVHQSGVPGLGGERGTFELGLRAYPKPANDDLVAAAPLSGASVTLTGQTRGATRQTGEPSHTVDGTQGDASVWYTWQAPTGGSIRITVCDDDVVSRFNVAAYTQTGTTFVSLMAHFRRTCAIAFPVTAGNTYHIAVEGRRGDAGTFGMRLAYSQPPDNDNFADARELSGTSVTTTGDSSLATSEPVDSTGGASTAGKSVWFRWTAAQRGSVLLNFCGSDENVNRRSKIYRLQGDGSVSFVSQNAAGNCTASPTAIPVAENDTLMIVLDGISGSNPASAAGPYVLNLTLVDDVNPVTEITSPLPGDDVLPGSHRATFFSPTHSNATFECSLNGAAFSACTSPLAFPGITGGSHTLRVRALTSPLNVDTSPAEVTFTVDASPPQTSITQSPGVRTTDSTPTFGYRSSEENSSFECRIDSAPFVPCNGVSILEGADAEFTPAALGDGPHRFEVKSSDEHGNVDDTVAAREFTVDATPPVVTIDSGPADVRDQTPTFRYSASEPGAEFSCRIDAGPAFPCSDPSSDAASQAELTTIALADGNRTFEVRATDASGNRGEFVMLAFRIDRNAASADGSVAPETVLDKKPRARLVTRGVTKKLGFTFSSPTAGATFECAIQRKKRRKASLAPPSFGPCTSPKTYKKKPGIYRFSVRAVSGGLPDETPATYTLTILQSAAP